MNERTIFITALEKQDSAQRKEYLDEVCAGDPVLRDRLEALIRSHEREGRFLDVPAVEQLAPESVTRAEMSAVADEGQALEFLTPSDKPGSLGRLGHYEIQEVIGEGGMGIVLKAFDEKLHRVVAIKLMAPQLAVSATARKRFIREAQAAAAVSHDHIVTIHAVEESDRLPYLVMQYVSGLSLQQRLDRDGPFDLPEILRIGMQMASGLAAAHAQGLVHRDIKPANILLENGVERVKITDFGLARAAAEASLTQTGIIAGTPQYMSPEQAEGMTIDQRSDFFSLGSVLYAMCTGRAPFRASGSIAVLRRVYEEMPSPIRETRPETPEWLVEIIEKLHAKDPAERFQSAAEVAELLGQHLAHVQHPSVSHLPRPIQRGTGAGREWRSRGPGRRWTVAAAVFVLFFGCLSLTEATGVTRLTATVIRILAPNGTLVVEVDDPGVKVTVEGDGDLVITGTGAQEVRLRPGSYRVLATKDGKPIKNEIVTISRGDKRVVAVRLEPGAAVGEIRRFEGHIESVHALAVSADGTRAVTGSWDKTVRVWDLGTGQELRCFSVRDPTGRANNAIYGVALSPDKKLALACSRQGTVWLWDVETGEERWQHAVPVVQTVGATCVAFSPNGRSALVGGGDGFARQWQLFPWKEIQRLKHSEKNCCWSVCYSPDGRQALTAGGVHTGETGDGMRLWDLQTGAEVRRFKGHQQGVWCAVFSPDSRYVLSGGSDATLRLWARDTAKELRRFSGHTGEVRCVAFSPDGRKALSASTDQTIRLWDVETGQELHRFFDRESHGEITSVAFVPPGRQALWGNFQGMVRLWQLPP